MRGTEEAQNDGGSICRIATHCTEADVSIEHFGLARELGLETIGPEKLAAQAQIMADARCQRGYYVDSAGARCSRGVADRVSALEAELGDEAQVGFHGDENLGLRGQLIEAVRAGAKQIDGSCRRFGQLRAMLPWRRSSEFDTIAVKTEIDSSKPMQLKRSSHPRCPLRMPAGPQGADHGLLRRVFERPRARDPPVRALRRVPHTTLRTAPGSAS